MQGSLFNTENTLSFTKADLFEKVKGKSRPTYRQLRPDPLLPTFNIQNNVSPKMASESLTATRRKMVSRPESRNQSPLKVKDSPIRIKLHKRAASFGSLSVYTDSERLKKKEEEDVSKEINTDKLSPLSHKIQGLEEQRYNISAFPAISKQSQKKSLVKSKDVINPHQSEGVINLSYPRIRDSTELKHITGKVQRLSTHKYFNDSIKTAILDKDKSKPSTKSAYNYFMLMFKDLVQMSDDRLIEEAQFMHKLKLRSEPEHPEFGFFTRTDSKPLLVLDLDETLIHYSKDANKTLRHQVLYSSPKVKNQLVLKFNLRPNLQEFLEVISQHYIIFVFTASDLSYASTMVHFFDPLRKYISRIFDRRFCCITKKGFVVKDLRIFSREFRQDEMLLVDNSVYCFLPQLANGVPIIPFEDDFNDSELIHLTHYLISLAKESSISRINASYFKLDLFRKYNSAKLLEHIL